MPALRRYNLEQQTAVQFETIGTISSRRVAQ
jgi:hypothetical protein